MVSNPPYQRPWPGPYKTAPLSPLNPDFPHHEIICSSTSLDEQAQQKEWDKTFCAQFLAGTQNPVVPEEAITILHHTC